MRWRAHRARACSGPTHCAGCALPCSTRCAIGGARVVTVSIAALGTAAILLAGGFALFTYQGLAQISARTTGHLIVGKPEQFQRDEDTPLQHGLDNVAAIKARAARRSPGAARAAAGGVFGGLISNGDKSTVMLAAGIDPDAEFAVKGPFLRVLAGDVLASGRAQHGDAGRRPRTQPEGHTGRQPHAAGQHHRRRAQRHRRHRQGRVLHRHPRHRQAGWSTSTSPARRSCW